MRAKLEDVKEQLRRRMHDAIPEQGRWLKAVVTGYFAYHAVPTNFRALQAFHHHVTDLWRRTLARRSQKAGLTWERMAKLAAAWLPTPHILHPWPSDDLPSTTQGRSRMPESGTYGSVRGVPGNGHPYRDNGAMVWLSGTAHRKGRQQTMLRPTSHRATSRLYSRAARRQHNTEGQHQHPGPVSRRHSSRQRSVQRQVARVHSLSGLAVPPAGRIAPPAALRSRSAGTSRAPGLRCSPATRHRVASGRPRR